MNTQKDIERISKDYYIKAGLILQEGGRNNDETSAKQAELIFSEGLSKLKALKLSAKDRQNIRLFRNAFEFGIKFTNALQKGHNNKAEQLAEQSASFAHRYNQFVMTGVDSL